MGQVVNIVHKPEGLDLDSLPPGTQLRLGEGAVIEVVKRRTGCSRLQSIQGCTPAQVAGRLGVLARVLRGGTVRVGDPVALVGPDKARPEG